MLASNASFRWGCRGDVGLEHFGGMRHQRFVHLNRGRIIQQECELGTSFAELNIARRLKYRFGDALAVDERSVCAVQIVNLVVRSFLADFEMMDRYGRTIDQRNIVLGTAANARDRIGDQISRPR